METRGSIIIKVSQQGFPKLKEMTDLRELGVGFSISDDRRVNRHRWNNAIKEVEATLVNLEILDIPLGLA